MSRQLVQRDGEGVCNLKVGSGVDAINLIGLKPLHKVKGEVARLGEIRLCPIHLLAPGA